MKYKKIVIQSNQLKPLFSKEPLLVSGFLSYLIDQGIELNEFLNPHTEVSKDMCILEFLVRMKHFKKVLICGDYDCDGITSTALLTRFLRNKKIEVGFYCPNRLTEGYGASLEKVKMAHECGYSTVILLDNGVINSEVHQYCKEQQIELIVIDHHTIVEPVLCDLLIHPDMLSDYYYSLCSAGLVFTIIEADGSLDDYDKVLAGIGTIGDVMPLIKQNRGIVHQCLSVLNEKSFGHISQLLTKKVDQFIANTIAFSIVPVFNAPGRLADRYNVNNVVKYLLSEDNRIINSFAAQLLEANTMRKELSANQTQLALTLLQEEDEFIMIHNELFHEGIVGIIAGKVAHMTRKPTMILTGNNHYKGSIRSIDFDAHTFLSQFNDYYLTFGGHKFACALSLEKEHFPSFREEVLAHMNEIDREEPTQGVLVFDQEAYQYSALERLSAFEPFGQMVKIPPIYVEALVIGVRKIKGGVLINILPQNDLTTILIFDQSIQVKPGNYQIGAIGTLEKGYNGKLSLIATDIFVL